MMAGMFVLGTRQREEAGVIVVGNLFLKQVGEWEIGVMVARIFVLGKAERRQVGRVSGRRVVLVRIGREEVVMMIVRIFVLVRTVIGEVCLEMYRNFVLKTAA